jgi:hypothetical protein
MWHKQLTIDNTHAAGIEPGSEFDVAAVFLGTEPVFGHGSLLAFRSFFGTPQARIFWGRAVSVLQQLTWPAETS